MLVREAQQAKHERPPHHPVSGGVASWASSRCAGGVAIAAALDALL
ncbi:hypothetical protein [Ramlibacter rhizophilus]|nr:hypothetical protein [Ramlibacter rhizophilus]